MKKINVSEATNNQLDWLVAEAKQISQFIDHDGTVHDAELIEFGCDVGTALNYTTNPTLMHPVIERETISTVHRHRRPPHPEGDRWNAVVLSSNKRGWYGQTPLIAAARCLVATKLGEVVEVPEELT